VVHRLLALASLAFLAACTSQYSFVAPELPIQNPAVVGTLGPGEAVAVDGLTKHRWNTYSAAEACFESNLSDLRPSEIDGRRPFLLSGFTDQSQPIDKVPTIASARVLVKETGQDDVKTNERRFALPHLEVEVCFEKPGRVVRPDTRWVVLRVPYSVRDEEIGSAGSRDGVWRLTK
jgi:hypothetical protein